MWLEINNEATQSLKLPWMDEPIEFNDSRSAQVDAEVGEQLANEIDLIEIKDTETETDNE
jgi:hypothetical protein